MRGPAAKKFYDLYPSPPTPQSLSFSGVVATTMIVRAMVMLFEVMLAIFLEKTTKTKVRQVLKAARAKANEGK